jgi:hypothetical protein
VIRCRRGVERGQRRQRRHASRRAAVVAQAGAAGEAAAQVGAQRGHVGGGRLPVGERGQERREALAFGAGLDPFEPPQQAGAALGQAPVDLRV